MLMDREVILVRLEKASQLGDNRLEKGLAVFIDIHEFISEKLKKKKSQFTVKFMRSISTISALRNRR